MVGIRDGAEDGALDDEGKLDTDGVKDGWEDTEGSIEGSLGMDGEAEVLGSVLMLGTNEG